MTNWESYSFFGTRNSGTIVSTGTDSLEAWVLRDFLVTNQHLPSGWGPTT
jgi:hypothetical protein